MNPRKNNPKSGKSQQKSKGAKGGSKGGRMPDPDPNVTDPFGPPGPRPQEGGGK